MKIHATFPGRLVILGFGSVGQAVLPLVLRHIDIDPRRITVLSKRGPRTGIAERFGVAHLARPLDRGNYAATLDQHLREGDFLLNVCVEVESVSLMEHCRRRGVLYLDTCIEPWPGRSEDGTLDPSLRSNYALREEALALRRDGAPTAVVTMGANPGLASHFVKRALLDLAADLRPGSAHPARPAEWARLASDLGVKAIHIAERDTQVTPQRKERDEFVNTWSVNGFVGEGLQPSEIGWGTHERDFPADGARHGFGSQAAIYLRRPGAGTRVRSWTPLEGPYHGFLITHGESISIADHLTLRDAHGAVLYRPTVHYAYHPCDDAVLSLHEMAGKDWKPQDRSRILRDEITSGMDELGVLLMGHARSAYWYGSRLTIEEARALAPYNSATSLQVAAGILAGMVWAIRNPRRGVVEPDDLGLDEVMEVAAPYLGQMAGAYAEWTPLRDRSALFPSEVDADDPWQFRNFRVL